ncbi:DNA-binding response regulator [Bordetella sp. LUAb4]|uniref:response regulator transcription factor n=1 Tax=Bordetella sp. LUAb4 TaxID=2843195 RepID=UPI001E2D5C0F|nr:DNA-binding response regulator [Bordetella sp. LUAb4]
MDLAQTAGRPAPSAAASIAGLRILIVDDSLDDRALLMEYLRQQGCRIYLADNGRDGHDKAQAIAPDLILMDIAMPVCDGIMACALLKANPATRRIPVIFLTAAGLPQQRVKGLTAGAIDYVVKPFNFEEIRLRITVHVTASRLGRANDLGEKPRTAGGALDGRLFRMTQDLLLGNLGETPDLASLARAVGTNAHRLNAAFRQVIGMTVFDYLFEERMKRATTMLTQTTLDIQAVAAAVGYGTRQNFATAFRKRYGFAPTELRQMKAGSGQ